MKYAFFTGLMLLGSFLCHAEETLNEGKERDRKRHGEPYLKGVYYCAGEYLKYLENAERFLRAGQDAYISVFAEGFCGNNFVPRFLFQNEGIKHYHSLYLRSDAEEERYDLLILKEEKIVHIKPYIAVGKKSWRETMDDPGFNGEDKISCAKRNQDERRFYSAASWKREFEKAVETMLSSSYETQEALFHDCDQIKYGSRVLESKEIALNVFCVSEKQIRFPFPHFREEV